MINVVALYADLSGCGDYRVRFPADAVNTRSDEFDVHVTVADHLDAHVIRTGNRYVIKSITFPRNTRVVSFQRPTSALMEGAIRWLQLKRPDIAVVVELDDDLVVTPTANQVFNAIHPSRNAYENFSWLRRSIQNANLLTVSTPELAVHYGRHQQPVHVIRNAVPASMLEQPSRVIDRIRNDDCNRVIGWAGSVATHPGDLETTHGALNDIIGEHRSDRSVRFRNIGPSDGVSESLQLNSDFIDCTGWLSPNLYRLSLGELDIGIVPLAATRFNRSKSALKVLEMAAAGVPAVVSPTPEHIALRSEGMPIWIVRNNRRQSWVNALNHLLSLDNEQLRELGITLREYIRISHTIEERAHEWATAWKIAAQHAYKSMTSPRK